MSDSDKAALTFGGGDKNTLNEDYHTNIGAPLSSSKLGVSDPSQNNSS